FCCCNWNERATFWRARLVLNSTSGWYLIEPSAHWVRCAGNPIHRLPFVSNSWQLWMINPDGKVTNRNPRRLPSGRGFQFETVTVRCPPPATAGFVFVLIFCYRSDGSSPTGPWVCCDSQSSTSDMRYRIIRPSRTYLGPRPAFRHLRNPPI